MHSLTEEYAENVNKIHLSAHLKDLRHPEQKITAETKRPSIMLFSRLPQFLTYTILILLTINMQQLLYSERFHYLIISISLQNTIVNVNVVIFI